jgi:hypothetical protein
MPDEKAVPEVFTNEERAALWKVHAGLLEAGKCEEAAVLVDRLFASLPPISRNAIG